ncbi:MAG: hypothetical protein LW719_08295 [Comamonadaceae bacterium]|jgi:hypothetical protein|nr:hypothetical protein [Comamonadaceae bacterium]
MNSETWTILLVSGSVSFLIGFALRRHMNRRRRERNEQALARLRALAHERDLSGPPSHNKAKRKRQKRARQAED